MKCRKPSILRFSLEHQEAFSFVKKQFDTGAVGRKLGEIFARILWGCWREGKGGSLLVIISVATGAEWLRHYGAGTLRMDAEVSVGIRLMTCGCCTHDKSKVVFVESESIDVGW